MDYVGIQQFRFEGTMCNSRTRVTAPVGLGGKKYMINWYVMEALIPLLWGKQLVKEFKGLLDSSNVRVKVRGKWMNLVVLDCNQRGFNMLPGGVNMDTFGGWVTEDGNNEYKVVCTEANR